MVLVSSLLTDPELYVRSQNILKPSYFCKQLQPVVKLMIEHSQQYNGLPSYELIKANTGVDITPQKEVTDATKNWTMDTCESFCRHMALQEAILTSAEYLENGFYGDVELIIKEAILVGLQRDLGLNYYEDPKTRLSLLLDENGSISSGWKSLDKLIFNISRGELLLFSAESGHGKSVVLQNLAVNWSLQGGHCIYFTFELQEGLVAKRIDSMLANIPNSDIFKNIDRVDETIRNIGLKSGNIHIKYMRPGTNVNDLKAYLKEYQIQTGIKPNFLLVDYLDLMGANSKSMDQSNTFQKDKAVSEELRGLSMEGGYVTASACQINRQGYGETVAGAQHISGGISKIFTADLSVTINNTAAGRERGEIVFNIMKTRNSGSTGKSLVLNFDVNTLRITDMITADSVYEHKEQLKHSIETKTQASYEKNEQLMIGNDSETVYNSKTGEVIEDNCVSPALRRILEKSKGR